MARLIGNVVLAVTVFAVAASNVAWSWANNYLAAFLAIGAGFLAQSAVMWAMALFARRRMRRLYGQDWR